MADAVARHVVTFGRVLREAGLEVGPGRLADALTGLDLVELFRSATTSTGRCGRRSSRAGRTWTKFDAAFRAWFLRAPTAPVFRQGTEVTSLRLLRRSAERKRAEEEGGESGEDQTSLGYSPDELLRRRDFADMTPEEMENVSKLICAIASGRPRRKSRRLRPHHRGRDLDMRRLVRESLGTGGDAIERTFRSRVHVPRKLVVLCDVSGSMESYARALVLFLHALARSGRGVETFAFGTRLTRLTRELIIRDPEGALRAASERVVDWSGGTRIGHSLKAFNDEWGTAGAHARRRRRHRLRRLGAGGCGRRRARDGAARAAGVRGRLGQSAEGASGLPAPGRRHAGGAAVRRPLPLRAQSRQPRRIGRGPHRNREEACSVKEILEDVERWRAEGKKVAIATVVATRRSAPRPIGAKLAISETGELCGSVSGGCVESDVYENAREVLESGEPKLLSYGIADEEAWEVGLPCGGEIDVFVEGLEED